MGMVKTRVRVIDLNVFNVFDNIQEDGSYINNNTPKFNMVPLQIASGVMTFAGGIMKGIGDSAEANRRNNMAIQAHYTETVRSGQRNGKAVFESARNHALQMIRNKNIAEAAYLNKQEGVRLVNTEAVFKQNELATAVLAQVAAVNNVHAGKNISGSSGSANAMAKATTLNALKASNTMQANQVQALANLEKEQRSAMSARTSNVWIPNMEAPPNPPMLENTTTPLISGIVGGIAGGLTAAGSMAPQS